MVNIDQLKRQSAQPARAVTQLGDEAFHTRAAQRMLTAAVTLAASRAVAAQHTGKHTRWHGKPRFISFPWHRLIFFKKGAAMVE